MIEDYMNTPYTLYSLTETTVNNRLSRTWAEDETNSGMCAIFTASNFVTVTAGKKTYTIEKNLYCPATKVMKDGDYIVVNGKEYDVVNVANTNNINHHLKVSLSTRNT